MAEKFYKLRRAKCRLCGKDCAERNAEPRHHRCTHLKKAEPMPLVPVMPIAFGLAVSVDLDEVSRLMSPPQIQALMIGIARVVAAANSVEGKVSEGS